MYARIFKAPKKAQNPDTACYEAEDGTLSNGELHAEIMKGVDDSVAVAYAREQCATCLTAEELDAAFPTK